MQVLGIRFSSVTPHAEPLERFFRALGMDTTDDDAGDDAFPGAVFAAGESRVEVLPHGPQQPEGLTLQVLVDDADRFAEHARACGLAPHGPVDVGSERTYFLIAPGGLRVSLQSVKRARPRPTVEEPPPADVAAPLIEPVGA